MSPRRTISRPWTMPALLTVVCLFAVVLAPATALADEQETRKEIIVMRHSDGGGYLGVQIREETDNAEGGARVTGVVPDSPADEAGITKGDIIVGFDGDVIRGPAALTKRIHKAEPGDEVRIGILRDGSRQSLEVKLGKRPRGMALFIGPDGEGIRSLEDFEFDFHLDDKLLDEEFLKEHAREYAEQAGEFEKHMSELREQIERGDGPGRILRWRIGGKPRLGVQLVDTTRELREHLGGSEDAGVLVGKVLPGTPAEAAGVQVGDLIVAVVGESIGDPGDLIEALNERVGKTVDLEIVRNRRTVHVQADLPDEDNDTDEGVGIRAGHVAPVAPVRLRVPEVRVLAVPAPPAPVAAPEIEPLSPAPPARPAPVVEFLDDWV